MTIDPDAMDVTQARCWSKKWPTQVLYWDSRQPEEPMESVEERHELARVECMRCPLLEICEQALSQLEREDLHVDGVMAGRYSDARLRSVDRSMTPRQSHCEGCGQEMEPQAGMGRGQPLDRHHVGQGLCDRCWPFMARRRTPRLRRHRPNNPYTIT